MVDIKELPKLSKFAVLLTFEIGVYREKLIKSGNVVDCWCSSRLRNEPRTNYLTSHHPAWELSIFPCLHNRQSLPSCTVFHSPIKMQCSFQLYCFIAGGLHSKIRDSVRWFSY